MTTQNVRIPSNTNTNNLQASKFGFILDKLPLVSYMCQSVTIPGVSATPVAFETPFSTLYVSGDKPVYDQLSLTFQVDEDMKNWEEIFNWIVGTTFPENHEQYKGQKKKGIYSDATLTIYTNSNVPNMRFIFKNCQVVSLGSINMATTDDANMVPLADLQIQFDSFRMERIKS